MEVNVMTIYLKALLKFRQFLRARKKSKRTYKSDRMVADNMFFKNRMR